MSFIDSDTSCSSVDKIAHHIDQMTIVEDNQADQVNEMLQTSPALTDKKVGDVCSKRGLPKGKFRSKSKPQNKDNLKISNIRTFKHKKTAVKEIPFQDFLKGAVLF